MKNKRFLGLSAAFALTLAIGMTSCKKDKDDNSPASKFSATIGTTAFAPQIVNAVNLGGDIMISGFSAKSGGDSSVLQINFPDTAKVNSTFDITSYIAGLSYWNTKGTIDYGGLNSHGSITITAFDKAGKKVAGNFSGVIYNTPYDSLVIKDGKFNTTYLTF